MEGLDFISKVVIVTGASSGIGAETARVFAERGASLTLVGRNEAKLSETAKYCTAKNGKSPLCVLVDLTYHGSCEKVITKTIETYGKIDVLVNSAGKLLLSSIFDQSMEIFDELMALNLRVPYFLTQLALPHLVKTKGNVVNVGYPMLHRHRPGFLPYTLTKSALETFTRHAAAELTPEGVRINCVSPGVTRTNILENLNIQHQHHPSVYNSIAETMPNGRVMEPREVAMLILLSASDAFPNISGSNLLMDGAISTV